jgi:hypothetical protein
MQTLDDPTYAELEKKVQHLQSKIDSLMLEFCPDEMTKEQKENWAEHQQSDNI